MEHNGCKPESINSAIVRGCYDYVFGYIKGCRKVGAGVGTIALLRLLLTYKGSIFYALQEPMGDFLFAPLYTYLCKRDVKFKFFHRLDELQLSNDGSVIEKIALGRQVKLKYPVVGYKPLIDVPGKDYKSWPTHPDYDQIEHGDELKDYDLESAGTNWRYADTPLTLMRHGRLAIVLRPARPSTLRSWALCFGGLPSICGDLCCHHPDTWGSYLKEVQTPPTLALQLWLTEETEKLGWPDPRTVMVGFARADDTWNDAPLHSWEDNTPLIARKSANSEKAPDRSLILLASFRRPRMSSAAFGPAVSQI